MRKKIGTLLLILITGSAYAMMDMQWLNTNRSILPRSGWMVGLADTTVRQALIKAAKDTDLSPFQIVLNTNLTQYTRTIVNLLNAYEAQFGSVEEVITQVVTKAGGDPTEHIRVYQEFLVTHDQLLRNHRLRSAQQNNNIRTKPQQQVSPQAKQQTDSKLKPTVSSYGNQSLRKIAIIVGATTALSYLGFTIYKWLYPTPQNKDDKPTVEKQTETPWYLKN